MTKSGILVLLSEKEVCHLTLTKEESSKYFPFLAKLIGMQVDDVPTELLILELTDGTRFEYELTDVPLHGWVLGYMKSNMDHAQDADTWVEVGEREDESLYIELLFTDDDFDVIYENTLGDLSDDYQTTKRRCKVVIDSPVELYHSIAALTQK